MATFKEGLIASTKSESSAYMQFISGVHREGFLSYAFVEDDEDMTFYQHALPGITDISYLSCGGKENVLKVYRRLSRDGLSAGQMFFVDRDTEVEPYEGGEDICRTTLYSWESYVCLPATINDILGRKFRPTLTPKERRAANSGWLSTIQNYHEHLTLHTSLTHLANHNNMSLGMREVSLSKGAGEADLSLQPSEELMAILCAKRDHATLNNADLSEQLRAAHATYRTSDHFVTARGKSLFQLVKAFLAMLQKRIGKKYFGDPGSPLAVLMCVSQTSESLSFIREYAQRRIAEAAALAQMGR